MDPVIAPSVSLYSVNTRLFEKALVGLTREQLLKSPVEGANPLLWIAGHVANTRFGLAAMLDRKQHRPWGDLFNRSAVRPSDPGAYPEVEVVHSAWIQITAVLDARFAEMTDGELSAPSPRPFPVSDPSLRGAISFLAYHEGYHLGQMAYIRKSLGFPGLVES